MENEWPNKTRCLVCGQEFAYPANGYAPKTCGDGVGTRNCEWQFQHNPKYARLKAEKIFRVIDERKK